MKRVGFKATSLALLAGVFAACGDYAVTIPDESAARQQVYEVTDLSCSYGPQVSLVRFESKAAYKAYMDRVNAHKYLSAMPTQRKVADLVYSVTPAGELREKASKEPLRSFRWEG